MELTENTLKLLYVRFACDTLCATLKLYEHRLTIYMSFFSFVNENVQIERKHLFEESTLHSHSVGEAVVRKCGTQY